MKLKLFFKIEIITEVVEIKPECNKKFCVIATCIVKLC